MRGRPTCFVSRCGTYLFWPLVVKPQQGPQRKGGPGRQVSIYSQASFGRATASREGAGAGAGPASYARACGGGTGRDGDRTGQGLAGLYWHWVQGGSFFCRPRLEGFFFSFFFIFFCLSKIPCPERALWPGLFLFVGWAQMSWRSFCWTGRSFRQVKDDSRGKEGRSRPERL